MNNEEKILAMLEQMQGQMNQLETKVDEGFDRLEYSLNKAWEDIAIVDKSIQRHEKEFHSA